MNNIIWVVMYEHYSHAELVYVGMDQVEAEKIYKANKNHQLFKYNDSNDVLEKKSHY